MARRTDITLDELVAVGRTTSVANEFAAGDCWIWNGALAGKGYGVVSHVLRYAHRVAYSCAHGQIPPGLQVAHLCGEKRCVNPSHLTACSQGENERHKVLHGRTGRPPRPRKACGSCGRDVAAMRSGDLYPHRCLTALGTNP